ncbi:hypothetical protein P3X46_001225 [Hevea brasiliensis]|uniref:AAA+ ATPase domain-containing protein n=1 Tax=Hevea brasiliensis TaxID=3981 RepID=A0ABQ9NCE9_HEVBR|nr:disease resistance protein SUMM2-like [Hevea brasiliensis]KAJ9189986.1 hypothetical protein P3X46_001225 [Hevea brasiliensis]
MSGIEAAAAIGPVCDAIKGFSSFCCARADYFDDLEAHLMVAQFEMDQLEIMKKHVVERVKKETKPQMQQRLEVTFWLEKVNHVQEDAKKIIKEAEEEICKKVLRWFCPKKCCSYKRVGKRVSEKRGEVNELIEAGKFDAVVERKPVDLVIQMPVRKTFGFDFKLEEIWTWIEHPSVEIIGLYGMAGVGKTTLLKKIYNKFCEKSDYVLIFVERSEQDPVKAAKEAICKKFGISQEEWKNKGEPINNAISNILGKEKFALMLDGVGGQWLHQLLDEIGVHLNGNGNGSKVIFTTRSKEVCDRMKAKTIEVERLPPETALQLFEFCVGGDTLNANGEIPILAEELAGVCNGLPLLLTTIGRAMASKTKPRDWERAIEKLKTQPSSFPDVEASVFPVLKISYDSLSEDTLWNSLSTDSLRKCFLYFSLFPGVDNIKKMELTELWIAEGFLDQSNSTHEAREKGEDALGSLKSASLLETGKSADFVKMHDVIKAMTLWLACEEGKAKDKVLVQEKTPQLSTWINAERISLCGPCIESPRETPSCHHLTTLLLRATNLEMLPSEFFQSMPALRVLDLSDNKGLIELHVGIGYLGNLRYLNLSGTCIKKLPVEVQNLKKLQFLILDRTPLQLDIPVGVISSLSSLQAFRRVFDQMLLLNSPLDDQAELLKELESLEHIDEIGIFLSHASSVQKVSDTHKLRRCVKQLQLAQCTDRLPKLSLRGMEHLERLELLKCSSLTELEIVKENNQQEHQGSEITVFPGHIYRKRQQSFPNLCIVRIRNCPIKNVTCLINIPSLQSLKLCDCNEIVQVISEDSRQNVFENLVKLSLKRLPKLKSIYCQALQFPSLVKLAVFDCPNLRSLPLDCNSAKKLRQIKGSGSWWNDMVPEGIRDAFSSKFRETDAVVEHVLKEMTTEQDEVRDCFSRPRPVKEEGEACSSHPGPVKEEDWGLSKMNLPIQLFLFSLSLFILISHTILIYFLKNRL